MENESTPENDELRALEDPNDLGRRRITLLGILYRLAVARYRGRRYLTMPTTKAQEEPEATPQKQDQSLTNESTPAPSVVRRMVAWLRSQP